MDLLLFIVGVIRGKEQRRRKYGWNKDIKNGIWEIFLKYITEKIKKGNAATEI